MHKKRGLTCCAEYVCRLSSTIKTPTVVYLQAERWQLTYWLSAQASAENPRLLYSLDLASLDPGYVEQ